MELKCCSNSPSPVGSEKRSLRGYNLIEVLIAMALLSGVLLSIVTLFFFGRRNVYSGKQMTQAVAVGTNVMEDLSGMTVQNLYSSFGIVAASPLGGPYTVFGTSYPSSLLRSTNATIIPSPPADISTATDPDGAGAEVDLLTKWNNLMVNNRKFQNGSVTVVITPLLPASTPLVDGNGRPNATLVRIRTIVSWKESLRNRLVILDSVKTRR